jgi:hypothetical protein
MFVSQTVEAPLTSETVLANFNRFEGDRIIRYNAPMRFNSFGSCRVDATQVTDLPSPPMYQPDTLDAGTALNVKNPGGVMKEVKAVGEGSYFAYVGGETNVVSLPPYLFNGTYVVDNGLGAAGVGALRVTQELRSPAAWTNIPSTRINVTRSDGYRVTWSGGDASRDFVAITGSSIDSANKVRGTFFCTERADAGAFTVPAYVLMGLPASDTATGTYLAVGSQPLPSQAKVKITGLDQAYFYYNNWSSREVNYR